jgi:hypothetical protein
MVLVILETDYSDGETIVIGVASNRANALKMVDEYYGKDRIINNFRDIRDSGLDCSFVIEIGSYRYSISIQDFYIDEI